MLLLLGPGEPREASKVSVPQLRASSHQQPQLLLHTPPARQAPALAARGPAGAEVAARSQPGPHSTQTQAKAALTFPFAGFPGQKQDSQSGGRLAAQSAAGGQVQVPVSAKHKRPGLQLQAKPPTVAKAVPSAGKVSNAPELLA
jgi:hypothetical protein